MYLFLEEDLERVRRRHAEYVERLAVARGGIHESTTQSSETWHDNPAFDEQQQQSKMWNTERGKLAAILAEAELVQPPDSVEVVAIGTAVSVSNLTLGLTDRFVIASYMTLDDDEDRVSYAAPIGAALLGSRVGDKVTATIGSRTMELEVLEIEIAPT